MVRVVKGEIVTPSRGSVTGRKGGGSPAPWAGALAAGASAPWWRETLAWLDALALPRKAYAQNV
ncbi:hypothetical protein [Ralstonia solanacearum]|uniref:hypothetical protein n=1 Tax=Ralstonia solanacearum TaxID=305 RepID=UPI0013013F52